MDKVTTRSEYNNNHRVTNITIEETSEPHVMDQDSSHIKTPRRNYAKENSNRTKNHNHKGLLHRLAIFLLTSIGTHATIFNSEGQVKPMKTFKGCPSLSEYKIDFHDRSLKSDWANKSRKTMEIRDIIEDEMNPD